MDELVQVRGLSHRFGLHDVSLRIGAGEVVALLGPSGAGKTTLCRCVLALERGEQGTVELEGAPWSALSERSRRPRRRRYQYVAQDATSALDPQQTVLEHVRETLRVLADEPGDRAEALLDSLGLLHRARALPRELSAGEQRRVTLARVLALRPRLVVADEPTSGLDPERREGVVRALLEGLPEGASCLWVTHEVDLALRFCTRVVGLVDGRIVDDLPWPTGSPTHAWTRRAMMPARSDEGASS